MADENERMDDQKRQAEKEARRKSNEKLAVLHEGSLSAESLALVHNGSFSEFFNQLGKERVSVCQKVASTLFKKIRHSYLAEEK